MYKFWQKLPGDRLRFSNCYCYAADFYGGGWCAQLKGTPGAVAMFVGEVVCYWRLLGPYPVTLVAQAL
jgi:hypothetical protein